MGIASFPVRTVSVSICAAVRLKRRMGATICAQGSSLAGPQGHCYQGWMPTIQEATTPIPVTGEAVARRPRNQLGILLMILAVSCLAAMEASAKLLIEDYPIEMVVWARLTLHFIVTLPVFFFAGRLRFLRTQRPGLHLVRSMFILIASLLFIGALTKIPLAQATALVFTSPLLVTALSALILRERVGIRRWLAILVGFIGVVVLLRPGGDFDWFLLLPLATGFCYAGYQFSTRVLSFTEPTLTLFFYTAVAGAVITTAALPFYWVTPDLEGAAIFLMTGLLGFLGQFFMIRSLQEGEASTVTPFMYAQLIWATLFGLFLFGNFPDVLTFVGAGIIVGSGIYIWHRERLRAQRGSGSDTGGAVS